jgi:3-isopropylmalate/(R)-2-methylmalate dehydratase large subunit
MGQTLFEKIWQAHVVKQREDGSVLLYVDRHVLHDLVSQQAFADLQRAGHKVHSPELAVATHDHIVSSAAQRRDDSYKEGEAFVTALRRNSDAAGIRLFGLGDAQQGIVHVMAPELGIVQPGCVLVCGDSHTCTDGALGALAMGIGTSEVAHVLATQTLVTRQPKTMRVSFHGALPAGLFAKDLILHLIATVGQKGGVGFAVEYAGPTVEAMPIEARLTLCNMSIEFGARVGMVAPDETTYAYLKGRKFAPQGALWDQAIAYWRRLPSDPDARYDKEVTIDASTVAPHVTWGTAPQQVVAVTGHVPDPQAETDAALREGMIRALKYMNLAPGTALEGLKIDKAFIGSCTNSRISDLRAAAAVVKGRKVAAHVSAMVVPGSSSVKREAEAEGLDAIFRAAGFDWRESACSMCAGVNDDKVGAGQRCISSSNRNFEGRQGPGARTHLASPMTVAASAIAGHIVDVRKAG